MTLQVGCIADDFTGATDIAGALSARGYRVVVVAGGAPQEADLSEVDAAVIALKTRTAARNEAVAASVGAAQALLDAGAERLFVKYCSTFDSTAEGNIGPVIDAVCALVGQRTTIAAPSFPANGRTVYLSHLFVGDRLLADSSMRTHPLTPMTESDLRRVLAPQTTASVAAVHLPTVRRGPEAVRRTIDALDGPTIVIVDAVDDDDLAVIAEGTAHLRVISGGSALAGAFTPAAAAPPVRPRTAKSGPRAIVCGSASLRTREQIAFARDAGIPARKIDPDAGPDQVGSLLTWARRAWADQPDRPVLFYATDEADDIRDAGSAAHHDRAERIEATLSAVADALVAAGVRRLIAAGGETSGRVVTDLGITALRLTREIAPGVSWAEATACSGPTIEIALKSGNFGDPDFFVSAWERAL